MTDAAPGTVMLIGASSPVARALADVWASRGHALALGGRDLQDVERIAADLRTRHRVQVRTFEYDALKPPAGEELVRAATASDRLAGIVVAVGDMGDEQRARSEDAYAERVSRINFSGLLPVLEAAAALFASHGSGFVIGIGSVAGDRPRKSNYTYAAAKADLEKFLTELRQRFADHGVRVLTVKPGYIDTRMTWQRASPIAADPERVARDIVRALDAGRTVIYTPWFWHWIMLVVRLLPKPLFRLLEDK